MDKFIRDLLLCSGSNSVSSSALHDRAVAASAACFGGPLPRRVDPERETILRTLTDPQEGRARDAERAGMRVAPVTPWMYAVHSADREDPSGLHGFYYVDLRDTSRCECPDLLYNCDAEDGEQCKHLWRVRFLVKAGALPEPGDCPLAWLADAVTEDARIAAETLGPQARATHQLVGLRERVEAATWPVSRERLADLYRARGAILSAVPRASQNS